MRIRPRGMAEDCCCSSVADKLKWIMERIGSMVTGVKVNGTDYHPDGEGKVQINLKSVGGQSLLGTGDIPVISETEWGDITGTLADQTDLKDALDAKANAADLATVATTGDYDDLIDKPTIPAAQIQSDWTQADSGAVDYIKNKPSLATVATTGDYDDLTDKPDLSAKMDAPSSAGTAGQVLKLDSNLDPVWANESGGGGSVDWGDIGGTLANQTDLANALADKADTSSLDNYLPLSGGTMTDRIKMPYPAGIEIPIGGSWAMCFGWNGGMGIVVGTIYKNLLMYGGETRPKYTSDGSNFKSLAFTDDIPSESNVDIVAGIRSRMKGKNYINDNGNETDVTVNTPVSVTYHGETYTVGIYQSNGVYFDHLYFNDGTYDYYVCGCTYDVKKNGSSIGTFQNMYFRSVLND